MMESKIVGNFILQEVNYDELTDMNDSARNNLRQLLEEFVKSELDCVEINEVEERYRNKVNFRTSVYLAIKSYGYTNVNVFMLNGNVYLKRV